MTYFDIKITFSEILGYFATFLVGRDEGRGSRGGGDIFQKNCSYVHKNTVCSCFRRSHQIVWLIVT